MKIRSEWALKRDPAPGCSQSEAPWRGDECADGPQELSTELLSQGGVASEEVFGQGTGPKLAPAFRECRADLWVLSGECSSCGTGAWTS